MEADKPIGAQIRTWSLSEGSPYETLHDYVANAFAPYFKAYVKETGKIERWVKSRCLVSSGGRRDVLCVLWSDDRSCILWSGKFKRQVGVEAGGGRVSIVMNICCVLVIRV